MSTPESTTNPTASPTANPTLNSAAASPPRPTVSIQTPPRTVSPFRPAQADTPMQTSELIKAIRSLNPTASERYLESFTRIELTNYLDRLNYLAGRRGTDTRWDRRRVAGERRAA